MYSIKPKGIILIGHSMGGIVIQSALMNAELDRKKIAFVLSFSTPYAEPRMEIKSLKL
jgi:predicted alpha/beta superfamily hydrolase